MNTTVDGEFQRYAVEDGDYIRDNFFGPDPRLRQMVSAPRPTTSCATCLAAATTTRSCTPPTRRRPRTSGSGRPTVILAKTVKGWTLGEGFEGRNATHQIKKMTKQQILDLRERLHLHDEIPEETHRRPTIRRTSARPRTRSNTST